MKLAIMKFVFTIIMFICWSTLTQSTMSTSIVKSTAQSIANDAAKFPNIMDQLLQFSCENELNSLDFNASISNINQNFISSPFITCLNFTDNHIENIERGAFNKLPNLIHLFLSNNSFRRPYEILNFGGHYKLRTLIANSAVSEYVYGSEQTVRIFGEYPNLEILSLRKNSLDGYFFYPEDSFSGSYLNSATVMPIMPKNSSFTPIFLYTPFPKLQILDLSENYVRLTEFLNVLPSNLYFLDLHNNQLESFNFYIADKLFALNLDDNHYNYISNCNGSKPGLSLTGLTDLQYLSVSSNRIKNIELNAFQDNKKLIYLNLSANHINSLHPETFAKLQYLKTLDLSQNKLENVPQISNEIGISILYINRNNITKLMSHVFVQMPKLTKLLLGENKINEIDVNAFANLSVLEKLDLSRNMLSSLPEGWTESLVSLKYLDLSYNQFTLVKSLSLTNAFSLIEIYLTITNPLALEHLNRYFESLPQNPTINLINNSSFAKWIPKRNYENGW